MYLLQPHSYGRTAGKLFILFLMLTLGARQGFAQYGGGAGTSGDPYLISTSAHLVTLSQTSADWDNYFRQTANIDLNGVVSLNPIGNQTTSFTGEYNGQNYTISNLTINLSGSDYQGLFGRIDDVGSNGGVVENLVIDNFSITGQNYVAAVVGSALGGSEVSNIMVTNSTVSGNFDTGVLVGECNGCSISNSTVDANSSIAVQNTGGAGIAGKTAGILPVTISGCTFAGTVSSGSAVGGMAGEVFENLTINNCTFSGTINGSYHAGGMIGRLNGSATGTITDCGSTGTVDITVNDAGGIIGVASGTATISTSYFSGTVDANNYAGGLVGVFQSNGNGNSSITNCYATGSVDGGWSGGFIGEEKDGGQTSLTNCYAAAVVTGNSDSRDVVSSGGSATVIATDCFYDSNINSLNAQSITGITGKTTAEMKDYLTFLDAGWDLVSETTNGTANIWDADQLGTVNNGYMILSWQDGSDNVLPTASYSGGLGTQGDPFQIATAADLVTLSGRNADWGRYFIQTADIDLTGESASFAPIGNGGVSFTGVYDGNSHTISNLTINQGSFNDQGLFGSIRDLYDRGILVKDLTIDGFDITGQNNVAAVVGFAWGGSEIDNITVTNSTVSGIFDTGVLVGECNGCSISNSTVDVNSSIAAQEEGGAGIAGGLSNTVVISDCTFAGSVTSGSRIGGMAGRLYGNLTISNCTFSGTINGSSSAGGMIGWLSGSATGTITDCGSTGTITLTGNEAGGMVGLVNDNGTVAISASYSSANISASAFAAGMIGKVNANSGGPSSLTNCYAKGMINSGWPGGLIGEEGDSGATLLTNCYSAASINNDGAAGDIVSTGGSGSVTATHCFYDEDVNTFTSQNISGISGRTSAEMKDYTTFTTAGWDFVSETTNGIANIWDADQFSTLNSGYPLLSWQDGTDDILSYTYSGGAGTQGDPYQIATAADLIALSGISGDWDKHFRQTANIDFGADETAVDWDNDGSPDGDSPAGFSPIGNLATEFTGSYDGDGKTISNLFINRPQSFYLGLFGQVGLSGEGISDLGLLNADITGFAFVGAIVGSIASSSTGSVSGCYSTGSVVGSNNQIGGLVGSVGNSLTSRIENCYSRCSVNGDTRVGGLVGTMEAVNTTTAISNCYSTGAVTGTGVDVGGLVGANPNGGITTDSFWDTQTSGQATSAGGTGKTTAEMQDYTTFNTAGWDFVSETANGSADVWDMDQFGTVNNGYPLLSWQDGADSDVLAPYSGGMGTQGDPYQIATAADLIQLSGRSQDWDKDFIQTADIDFGTDETAVDWDGDGSADGIGTAGFSGIGESTQNGFTGNYNGQGHTISNLFINQAGDVSSYGMFRVLVTGGSVSQLGLLNVNITAATLVGALVGYNFGGVVSSCYSTGSVNSNGVNSSSTAYVGGLIGINTGIVVENSYSTCSVDAGSKQSAGGLIGYLTGGTMYNCYSVGSVSGAGELGGFIGFAQGGDSNGGTNFWDTEASTRNNALGGGAASNVTITGKTTAEMKMTSTFLDAEWSEVWYIDPGTNDGYPNLQGIGTLILEGPYNNGAGAGTEMDPHQIASIDDLIHLSQTSADWGLHFIQVVDIDFGADETMVDWNGDGMVDTDDSAGFTPIGEESGTDFTGSYDGDGKTISNLFLIVDENTQGFFGALIGAEIKNLGILNANLDVVSSSFITGFGVLAGRASSSTTISNCYTTGTVQTQWNVVGGLVGINSGSTISNCYSSCSVTQSGGGNLWQLGGLVGSNTTGATIENCYSTGSINVQSGTSYIGGLAGVNSSATIENCYSTGSITGGSSNIGGLTNNINSGTVTNSFWDTETSGLLASGGGTGKSTAEMKMTSTFTDAGWSTPWYLDATENNGYPNLSGVGLPLASYGTDLTIVSSGGGTQNTDWAVSEGMLYGLSGGAVSVNASDLNNQLSTGDLELFGNGLTVSENIAPGSGTHTLTLGFSNGVTVSAGKGIDLGGSLVNNSPLTLTSTSTSYSSLKVLGTITGTGSISYERYTNQVGTGSSGGNDLVGTPFTGQTFGPFAAANTNLAASGSLRAFGPWDNTGTGFINYDVTANAGTTLTPGTGYRAATTDGSPVTFTGTVQTGNVTVNITDAASQWNAVANPYPAYLSMADFLNYDHGQDVTNQSLMVETAAGIYGYDGNSTDGWTVITLANASTSLMAPGQGFFVAADAADIDAYDLTFTPTMMRTGDSDDFINGFAPVNTPVYFKLQAFTDSRSYGTSVYFNEASATGLDVGYDAVLWGDAIPDFAVYTHLVSEDEGEPFALQSLGLSDLDDPELAIPLGLEAAAGIPLTLAITEEELPAGIEVYLLDSLNGERTLLSGLPYTFTPNAALSGAGRYYLVFNAGQVVSTSSETDGGDLSALVIYAPQYRDELVITGELPGAAQLSLYDVQGRKLLGRALSAGTTQQTVATGHLPGGIYLVRIESPQGVRAEQLFIP
ncbi:GLUG motif-containing protein [Phaeodactylibacter xiamenensis]|uniref:GLUG motif-containing protein n=1 Tax=Phaeodactylibacter xiamenensis TaxID=1524460 RepID=UPI003BA89C2C